MRAQAVVLAAALSSGIAAAAPLPTKPDRYVTDRTGRLDAARLSRLNEILAAFERETSTQVVLYVAARLPAGTTLEEVAAQAIAEWGIGQKGKDNGVLFLAFLDDRVMRIEVGYGLEGALPDARAHRIVTEAVTPRFRQGDLTGGLEAAAAHIMAAARGEPFQGTGQTAAESGPERWPFVVMFGLLGLVVVSALSVLLRWAWRRAAAFSHPLARRAARITVVLWTAFLGVVPFAIWTASVALGYVLLALFASAVSTGGIASVLQKRKSARIRAIIGRVALLLAAGALPFILHGLGTDAAVAVPLLVFGGSVVVAIAASAHGLGLTSGRSYGYASSGSGWSGSRSWSSSSSNSSSSSDSSSSSFSGGGGSSGGGGASGSW